ncbi:MAG: ABC transporter transmembrane domain-containing protein [Roseburia inulinivorans]
MDKFVSLTADSVNKQEPGTLVSRFVGDVDTVENLFTSGIISMFADVCKIISILVVIWFQNRGLTLVLLVLLPFLFWFTRHVQKNMLAAQIENRKAVGRASGHVPETLHNIRTIHCLAKEAYMEERYDTYIGESYAAMERTNFYDAVYSPVILILNAVVVAVVMLAFRVRKPHGTDLLWNVCRNCGCGHQLYLTDILPGGEPRNGDSDDSVCDCRNPQDQ